MTRARLMVELCAGLAAVSLRLQGGPHCRPPVSRMGNKAGYSKALLSIMGLRAGQGADAYLWCEPDPGCRALLQAYSRPDVLRAAAAIIRSWADEPPRDLWERLRAEGPIRGVEDSREVARWCFVHQGSFQYRGEAAGIGRPQGRDAGGGFGAVRAVADMLPHLIDEVPTSWPPVSVVPDAREVEPPADCTGVVVYADFPYLGDESTKITGYGSSLTRDEQVMLATRWADAGALVVLSESVPLDRYLPGEWWTVEITGCRVGQRRTFGGTAEWVTTNRPPAWRPAVQGGLFGVLEHDTGRGK